MQLKAWSRFGLRFNGPLLVDVIGFGEWSTKLLSLQNKSSLEELTANGIQYFDSFYRRIQKQKHTKAMMTSSVIVIEY
jgi:hypothetical protein